MFRYPLHPLSTRASEIQRQPTTQTNRITRGKVNILYSFTPAGRWSAGIYTDLATDAGVGINLRLAPVGIREVQDL